MWLYREHAQTETREVLEQLVAVMQPYAEQGGRLAEVTEYFADILKKPLISTLTPPSGRLKGNFLSKRNLFSVDKSLEKPETRPLGRRDADGGLFRRKRNARARLSDGLDRSGRIGERGRRRFGFYRNSRRDKPHPALFVGTGKAEELAAVVKQHDVGLVVFNHELTPTQERNLEKSFNAASSTEWV